MKRDKCLFFVYGSLKTDFYNNKVLGNSQFLSEFKTEPKYTLFDGGFPVVERGGDTSIHGELFISENVNDISNVFHLEGCDSQIQHDPSNWYDFDEIDTKYGKAVIFVMDKGKSGRTKTLNSGIWK